MSRLPVSASALAAATFVVAAVGGGVAVAQAVSNGSTSSTGTAPSAASVYAGIPSWLPQPTGRPDGVERGTVARPALTTQGDLVHAVLPGRRGSVDVRVTGPEIPGEGFSYQPQVVTTTFTVTFSHASQRIPVALRSFTVYDNQGRTHSLAPVAGTPPRFVRPGQVVSFQIRTALPVGEGMMRWAPVDNDLLGTWDFVSEND